MVKNVLNDVLNNVVNNAWEDYCDTGAWVKHYKMPYQIGGATIKTNSHILIHVISYYLFFCNFCNAYLFQKGNEEFFS